MVMIVGHRGARNLWPENSLDGFVRTRALGIEAVEFDIHPTRDGGLAVIHDPTLDRTTEGTGLVRDFTIGELGRTKLKGGNGEGIPMLNAVLDVFEGSGVELHIELKTDAENRPQPGLEHRLIEVIVRRQLQEQVIMTCFTPEVLETVRRLVPHQRVLASLNKASAERLGGLGPALDRFDAIGGCLVAIEKSLLAENFQTCFDRLGRERLGVWVPNEPDDIAYWMAQPIRQLTTDRPDIAVQYRK